MPDIKKIKKELLDAFNSAEAPPDKVARDDGLDAALSLYFNKASHMPKELSLEAVINSLKAERTEREVTSKGVKDILEKYQ